MRKQQFILVCCGFLVLVGLFFFGEITPPKRTSDISKKSITDTNSIPEITTDQLLLKARAKLTPAQVEHIISLENTVKRGDVKNQQIHAYQHLARYWEDTVRLFEPYAYYTAEAAKLENSEKSLTFAAHLFLNSLKVESQAAMQHWLATNAKDLFIRSLALNPTNDSSKIGLGACYIFGNLSDNPMEGIGLIREVVQQHPDNMFGQFILGLGGIKSGQYDKAIERFKIVLDKEPANVEAMLNLAEIYDRKGEKTEAIKWYMEVKTKVNKKEAQKELDARIRALK